jgi:hypothetical protein
MNRFCRLLEAFRQSPLMRYSVFNMEELPELRPSLDLNQTGNPAQPATRLSTTDALAIAARYIPPPYC